jgi:precorrin-2 dehydrogenase/sirohydrochlorin ferrochelatase
MLDVRGRPAVVVGGDAAAAEKAAALHLVGAAVTVLSPEFCADLLSMAERGEVTLRHKAYERGDLAGAFVVVAATTDNPALSEAIWDEACQNGQLLNVVDVPALCTFIVPSILRRGQLTIAVSTEGASPGLAKRIRQDLEKLFPPIYDTYLRLATAARGYLRQGGVSYRRRDEFFGDYYGSDVLALLAAGDQARATRRTRDLMRRYGVEAPDGALEEAV